MPVDISLLAPQTSPPELNFRNIIRALIGDVYFLKARSRTAGQQLDHRQCISVYRTPKKVVTLVGTYKQLFFPFGFKTHVQYVYTYLIT